MSTDSKNWTQIKHNKKNQQKSTFFSEHMDTEDSIENILRGFYIDFFIEIFDRKCLFLSGYFSQDNFLIKNR